MLKMKDIANHAGVSPTTVSFVLNERHEAAGISEKTRLKVLQAAEELGYRSNHLARAMRTGNTKMLGLLGGNPDEEQVGRMLVGALKAADAQGYTLKIFRLDAFAGSAQQIIRRSSELRLMGMLALHLPEAIVEELYCEARDCGTPLVLMDSRSKNPNIAQIISDDRGGVEAGVDHLVKLGHKKIAFMYHGGESAFAISRRVAFKAVMAKHGLPIPASYEQEGHFFNREQSLKAARTLLSMPIQKRPTAIFCAGDLMALSTLQVAHEFKINVPQDMSIVGFANITASEYAAPSLTTVAQPFVEIGREAVNLLLNIIGERDNHSGKIAIPQQENGQGRITILPTIFVERSSTAPPPQLPS
jgi:DNA-binding LacI/PurR family transcriptional regulator